MTESDLHKLYKKIFERLEELEFDISEAVIRFEDFFPKTPSEDIYSGSEKIPFDSKEKEYKLILKKEFL
jgi:hypothetical protein